MIALNAHSTKCPCGSNARVTELYGLKGSVAPPLNDSVQNTFSNYTEPCLLRKNVRLNAYRHQGTVSNMATASKPANTSKHAILFGDNQKKHQAPRRQTKELITAHKKHLFYSRREQ